MKIGDVWATRDDGALLVYDADDKYGRALGHIRLDDKDYSQRPVMALLARGGWKIGTTKPVTAGGDSWRWQLRDKNGKWIEMGSEVRWLARGLYKQGIVIGSPNPGIANVREHITQLVRDIPSNRLEVVRSAENVLERVIEDRQTKSWGELDLQQEPALVDLVGRAKAGDIRLTGWSSGSGPETLVPDEVRNLIDDYARLHREARTSDTTRQELQKKLEARLIPLGMTTEDIQHLMVALTLRLSDGEYRDKFWAEHQNYIEYDRFKRMRAGNVAIRIPQTALQGILEQGRYKSQFETGRSRGTYSPKLRTEVELDILGLHPSLDPAERPVYGYAYTGNPMSESDPDIAEVGNYGDVALLLKSEARARTTMTVGDSLGGGATPIPMTGDVSKRQIADAITYGGRAVYSRLDKHTGMVRDESPGSSGAARDADRGWGHGG